MAKATKQYTIGIDVGGTKIRAILFDGKKVLSEDTLATPQDSLTHLMVMLSALVDPLLEKAKKDRAEIKGIGVGIPGVINFVKKKIVKTPNVPILDGVDLEEKLKEKFNLPIKLDNDTNCFLRAEMKLGIGKKYKNAFGLIIGTGIGGAWWQNEGIYQGAHFGASEPGHNIINFDHPITLEEAYQKLNQNNPIRLAGEAYRGDTLSQKAFEEIGNYLGIMLANIINLIDPEVFIVGGGVTGSEDLFFPQMKKSMNEYIMNTDSKHKIKIIKGKLGKESGAIGAALLIEHRTGNTEHRT